MAPPVTIPAKPEGAKGVQFAGFTSIATDDQEGEDGADFDGDHDVIGLGRLFHSAHQQQR